MIVPTPVGVNRMGRMRLVISYDCPHARGGEPGWGNAEQSAPALSPRPWG